MKVFDPRLWIAGLSTFAVVWLSLDAIGRTAPGPLTTVHGRIPDLAGRHSCSECHGGWFSSMTESCQACHEPITEQIEGGHGLHGQLGAEKASACAACHSEHHGESFSIVNRASFALAGIPDVDAFDHALIGFPMDGRHMEIGCVACHENADDLVLQEGTQRYLGLQQDCATCHEDAHKGRMVLACADCHGQTSFDQLESKGHDRHLPLTGGHADVGCRKCHEDDTPRALESLGAGGRRPPNRECADCHESPHRDSLVEGAALLANLSAARSCGVCHEADHETFQDERLTVTPAQHAQVGFPLGEPHAEVACDDCHAPSQPDFAARHPGRSPDDCRVCHGDPHEGQFAQGPFADAGCIGCHERVRFEPHAFGIEQHERAALPLTGRHAETDCGECHVVPAEGAPRRFRGTPSTCVECHEDAHDDFFAVRDQNAGEDCARCHGTEAFAALPEHSFDHGRDTGFPIEGAHAQTQCESCHPRADEPDRFGRRFGRVSAHFGTYEGCVTCHTDPHQGGFDRPGLPAVYGGQSGCARCHVESSFRAFPQPFDHARWTGFPLTGAHEAASCAACHEPRFEPDEHGRTWGRAQGTRCADCHADPHADQFRVGEVTDCRRCHSATDSFRMLSFDHEKDSRFALGEAHAELDCSACHKPFPHEGGEVVRYRPLGTECADCHGKNDDPLRRIRRGRR